MLILSVYIIINCKHTSHIFIQYAYDINLLELTSP